MSCCFNDKYCGQYKPYKREESVITFGELSDVFSSDRYSKVNECSIIKSRIPFDITDDNDYICPFHRAKYGKEWRPSKLCIYPNHTSQKHSGLRPLSSDQHEELQNRFPRNRIPYGSMICPTHRVLLDKPIDPALNDTLPSTSGELDTSYVPDQYEVSPESVQSMSEISMSLEVSPPKHQIITPLSQVGERTLRYFKSKLIQVQDAALKKAAENFAPGQGEALQQLLFPPEDEQCPSDLQALQREYDAAQRTNEKIAILSLVSFEKYSKAQIVRLFNCTRYQVDKANNAFFFEEINRRRSGSPKLSISKAKHFIDFLFASGAVQEVAYGTALITFKAVENQRIPKAMLTVTKSHVIGLYRQYCETLSFKSLSDKTMYAILSELKLTQRKALSGLDNVSAAGVSAISDLAETVRFKLNFSSQEKSALLKRIEQAARYLKLEYKINCTKECHQVGSHCPHHAISDPKNKLLSVKCDQVHDRSCSNCENVLEIFSLISDHCSQDTVLNQDERSKADLLYDLNNIQNDIMQYMTHIIRDCQQEKIKTKIVEELTDDDLFWIKDWSQKVLPRKFREKQEEYFGKKGISQHVDVVLTKPNDTLVKHTYFTVLQRCTQDLPSTLAVTEHVAKQIKIDIPNAKNTYIKSDNAGCYAGNGFLEGQNHILKSCELVLKRHDYNEPQRGKDQCDRESATAQHLRTTYVNAGNDIQSAEDVKKSLLYMNGVRNAKASVVSVDESLNSVDAQTIDGISKYHSAEFYEDHVKLWNFYNIGAGKNVKMKSVTFNSGLTVESPFEGAATVLATRKQPSKKARLDRVRNDDVRMCYEINCVRTFANDDDLETHMLIGDHTYDLQGMDCIKQMYINNVSSNQPSTSRGPEIIDASAEYLKYFVMGWALPRRKFKRFSENVHKFMIEVFTRGEKTGQKAVPKDVVSEMRNLEVGGKKVFSSDEYLREIQVKQLFTRYAKKLREGTLLDPSALGTEEEHDVEIETQVRVETRDEVAQEIIGDVCNIQVEDWVLVVKKKEVSLGKVIAVQGKKYKVVCMDRCGTNSFKWPSKSNNRWYSNIIATLDPPEEANEKDTFSLNDESYEIFIESQDYV